MTRGTLHTIACSLLFFIAASLAWSIPETPNLPPDPPEIPQPPEKPGPPTLDLYIDAITPFTSSRQPATATILLPRGTSIDFHAATDRSARFKWDGAREILVSDSTSTARAGFPRPGWFTITIHPETPRADGRFEPHLELRRTISVIVTEVRAEDVQIAIIEPREQTVYCYVGEPQHCQATTTPPGYEHLIEWTGGELPAYGHGPTFVTRYTTIGSKTARAARDSLIVDVYRVDEIDYDSEHGSQVWYGYPITFTAATTPAGYEIHVPWRVYTHDDMSTRAEPRTGTGPTFTTTFYPTGDGTRLWAQVYGGNRAAFANPDPPVPPLPDPPPPPPPPAGTGSPPGGGGSGGGGGGPAPDPVECGGCCGPGYQLEINPDAGRRRLVGNRILLTSAMVGMDTTTVVWTGTGGAQIESQTPSFATVVFVEPDTAAQVQLTGMSTGGTAACTAANYKVISSVQQFPWFNGLTCLDTCPIDGCDCPDQRNDIEMQTNRFGGACDGSIVPHSGQELRTETDLFIKGRDAVTDLVIRRRHQTRTNYENSIFGPAWAFGYRHVFRELDASTVELETFGHFDTFERVSTNVWEGTDGHLGRLSYDGGDSTTLRLPGGTTMTFHTESDGGLLVGHVIAITSPNGNAIRLQYEDPGSQPDLLARKLETITDVFGRLITFTYVPGTGLVDTIQDFSGRVVDYDYDGLDRLVSKRSPVVTGTVVNDFPAGKTTTYTYHSSPDPRLGNALTSITYPREQAIAGPPRLQWTYYDESDPEGMNDVFFGFVKTHTVGQSGPTPPGGTYQYAYNLYDPEDPEPDASTAVTQLTSTDRRGTVTAMDFNRLGQVIDEEVRSQLFRPDVPDTVEYARHFEYTEDGDLTTGVSSLGTPTFRTHVDPAVYPRTSHANEIEDLRTPDDRGSQDQEVIRYRTVYEPVFNKVYQTIDPRAYEAGNSVPEYTTTFAYDYMEDLPTATAMFAPRLGLTTGQLADLFAAAGIVNLGQDVNGDGVTDQFCGNVIRTAYPLVSRPAQATQIGLMPVEAALELFQYNAFGQLIHHRDAEQNVTVHEYYGADDPDGNGVVDDPGADPTTGGYLRRTVRDSLPADGRNSGTNPPPVRQTTTYEYVGQEGGSFPENLRGVPTAIVDPRGIKHTRHVNALDQIVVARRASDVSASPEQGLTAFAYDHVTLYDANDQVVGTRVQNKDGLDGEDDFVVHTRFYDLLDQPVLATSDTDSIVAQVVYGYDASQNLVEVVRAPGQADEARETFFYDERDLLVRRTRGAGSPDSSTTATVIDLNGNVTHHIDAVDADTTAIGHDGFDRVRSTTDRVGNVTTYTYDSASNVLSTETAGPVDDTGGPSVVLTRTETRYDTRNRAFRTDDHIFHYAGMEVPPIDDGALDPGDGLVSRITIYDRSSRVVATVDADADLHEAQYDGLDRVLRRTDPADNVTEYTYDDNDNLRSLLEIERSTAIPDSIPFTTTFTYDALNRRLVATEPNGQTTHYEYDSRDNTIRTRDPLENETEYRYDRLDRLIDERIFLSADGDSASSAAADSAQGGGDGVIRVRRTWDDLDRLTTRSDDRGNITRYEYDDLDRKVQCVFPDSTVESWAYNADDELTMHVTPNGSVETWSHDAASRPTLLSVDNSLTTGTAGTTEKTWSYDGLDRVVTATDNNDPGITDDDVTCLYWYDSLSRPIREVQAVGALETVNPLVSGKSVRTEWQGAVRKVATTYPDGRRVVRSYDGLDRLATIDEGVGGNIATYAYIGPYRDIRTTYGNGTVLDKVDGGYDANRRHVRHEWRTALAPGGQQITGYVNTYNGPGGVGTNRRVTEEREHLGRQDVATFDSAYRMIEFDRDVHAGTGTGGIASTRTLDGVDKMTAFEDERIGRDPVVDGDPGGAGMNQYSSFDSDFLTNRAYDDDANLTENGYFIYAYDHADRLVSVTRAFDGIPVATYAYTADGRRVLRTKAGGVTRYLYDGWRVVEERDGAGVVQRQYVDGRGIDEHVQLREVPSGETYYYHGNSQGFVGALTDAAQNVVEYYTYKWLGRPTVLGPDGTDGGPDVAAVAMTGTVADVYFEVDHSEMEQFGGPEHWAPDELVGYYLEFDLGGQLTYFRIISNISYEGPVNQFSVAEDLETAGVLVNDAFRVVGPTVVGSAVGNTYLFQGRRYDEETQLYYYRNRYYSPHTGEFLTQDPMGSWHHGQGNGFSAFGEDGLNTRDPFGLFDWGAAAEAAWKGVVSVVIDIPKGIERSIDGLSVTDGRLQQTIAGENERMLALIGESAETLLDESGPLTDMITEILGPLPPCILSAIAAKVGGTAGGFLVGRVGSTAIATKLAKRVSARVAGTELAKQVAKKIGVSAGVSSTGVGAPIGLTMLQGVLQRAGESSRALRKRHPALHRRLRSKNLDMAFFLAEKHLEPYLEALEDYSSNPMGAYRKYCCTPSIGQDVGGGNYILPY